MTRDKELFSSLEEKDLHMHIEMGDDGLYSATGIGTVTFQRQSRKHLLKYVMHVPGLKNNLVQSQCWRIEVMMSFLVKENIYFDTKPQDKPRRLGFM